MSTKNGLERWRGEVSATLASIEASIADLNKRVERLESTVAAGAPWFAIIGGVSGIALGAILEYLFARVFGHV